MNYHFRKIQATDLDSVWALIELLKLEGAEISFADFSTKEDAKQLIGNPAQLTYVAVADHNPNQIACLVRGKRDLSGGKEHAAFMTAATHPAARGSGLAVQLTDFALLQMNIEGVNIARIYVFSNNQASLNTVRKLGFVHAGTVLRHHLDLNSGEYVDDLIFHKLLID